MSSYHMLQAPFQFVLILFVLLPLIRLFYRKDAVHRRECQYQKRSYDSTYRQIWLIFTIIAFLLLLIMGGQKQKEDTHEPSHYTNTAR